MTAHFRSITVQLPFDDRSTGVRFRSTIIRFRSMGVRFRSTGVQLPFDSRSIDVRFSSMTFRAGLMHYNVIIYHAKLHENMHTFVLRRVFGKAIMICPYSKVSCRDDCSSQSRDMIILILYYIPRCFMGPYFCLTTRF